jgi:hypothetical protein
MRRVNVSIDLTSLTEITQKRTVQETKTKTSATTDWAINVGMGVGAEALGSAGFIFFNLTNGKTGQTMQGSGEYGGVTAGVGVKVGGVDLKSAGATASFGSPTSFKTRKPKTWLDFEGAQFSIRSHSVGILIVGYEKSTMKIYFGDGETVDDIDIGGVTMGDLSLNIASIKAGAMWLIGEPNLTYTEQSEHEETEPFESSSHEQHRHVVLFETGNSEVTRNEMAKLAAYIYEAVSNYTEGPSP